MKRRFFFAYLCILVSLHSCGPGELVTTTSNLNLSDFRISMLEYAMCAVENEDLYCRGVISYLNGGLNVDLIDPSLSQGDYVTKYKKVLSGGVKTVKISGSSICALKEKDVYCWGRDMLANSPVVHFPDVTDYAVAFRRACAISQGGLYCIGANTNQMFGSASLTTPTLLQTGVTKVRFEGDNNLCFIKDRNLYCSGDRSILEEAVDQSVPKLLATDVDDFAVSYYGYCVLRKTQASCRTYDDSLDAFVDVSVSHAVAITSNESSLFYLDHQGRLMGFGDIPIDPYYSNTFVEVLKSFDEIYFSPSGILFKDGGNWKVRASNDFAGEVQGVPQRSRREFVKFPYSNVTDLRMQTNSSSDVSLTANGSFYAASMSLNTLTGLPNSASSYWKSHGGLNFVQSGVTAQTVHQTSGLVQRGGALYALGSGITGTGSPAPAEALLFSSGVSKFDLSNTVRGAIVGGSLLTWGSSSGGVIGNGTTSSTFPYEVFSSGVTDFSLTQPGSSGTICSIRDGDLYCWGDVGSSNYMTPQLIDSPVSPYSRVTAVISANYCAISNSNLFCGGLNSGNQVGNGTTAEAASPVQVLTGGVSDTFGTCAVKDSKIYCWSNILNSLGYGASTALPTEVPSSFAVSRVFHNTNTVCAISTGQELYCMGRFPRANGELSLDSGVTNVFPSDP